MALRMRIAFSDFAVGVWPVAVAVLGVLLVILRRRKHSLSYLFCFFVFGVYVLFALDKTFFPLHLSGEYVDDMRLVSVLSGMNLTPFHFGPFGTLVRALPGLLLNVILTIPFGFGLNFLAQVKARHFLWLAPAVGLGIETVQLVISLLLGYPYRFVDIDDVLMNGLGVWIGYGIFRVFAWLYVGVTQRLGLEHGGLAAYVYAVARRVHARPASL